MIKYAVFNPVLGTYDFCGSTEEANTLIAKRAVEFFKLHCAQTMCVEVTIDENGFETWANKPEGGRIAEDEIEKLAREFFK